jgi:uncharacterized protein DUF262/uncharacterized protein DUF1524
LEDVTVDDAYKRDLQDLLLDRIRFVVPPFQRNYVWTGDEWGRLFQDLLDTARRTDGLQHFLGAVVLQHAHERAGEPKIRDVVDGQQRLTTVQLLLAAIRDAAAARSLAGVANAARELTVNRPAGPAHELKVTSALADQDAFRHTMTAGGVAALRARFPRGAEPPVAQAYRFFADRIEAVLAAEPAGTGRDGAVLQNLLDVLGRAVYLVVLDLSERDDPQAIYERLNSGGAVLRPAELVRNHIFYQCARRGLAQERLYEEYWADFDDGYWFDSDSPRAPTRLDHLLRSYLIMEQRADVAMARLFLTFRDYIAGHADDLRGVLARIARYGEIFASLDTGDGLGPAEREFTERLRAIDSTVLTPVLLRLFGAFAPERRGPALSILESYLLRREICGLDTRSHADLVEPLLRLLKTQADPAPAIGAFLAGQSGPRAWPTNQQVSQAAVTRRAYQPRRNAALRMTLMLAERQLRTDKTEPVDYLVDTLTIEHLMPQAWRVEDWPIDAPDKRRREKERQDRTELIHTLGNLTLITEELNKDIANGPWSRKVVQLARYSNLRLNQHLPSTFDGAAAIRRRGQDLAELLCAALVAPSTWAAGPGRSPAVEGLSTEDTGEAAKVSGPDGTGQVLDEDAGQVMDTDDPEVSTARGRSSFGAQIRDALSTAGGPLTYLEIAAAAAVAYPDNPVPAKTVRHLLARWAVSGVRTTTKDGTTAGVLRPRRRRADESIQSGQTR